MEAKVHVDGGGKVQKQTETGYIPVTQALYELGDKGTSCRSLLSNGISMALGKYSNGVYWITGSLRPFTFAWATEGIGEW